MNYWSNRGLGGFVFLDEDSCPGLIPLQTTLVALVSSIPLSQTGGIVQSQPMLPDVCGSRMWILVGLLMALTGLLGCFPENLTTNDALETNDYFSQYWHKPLLLN